MTIKAERTAARRRAAGYLTELEVILRDARATFDGYPDDAHGLLMRAAELHTQATLFLQAAVRLDTLKSVGGSG